MKGGERAPRTLAGLSTPSCEFRDLDFDITPVGVWRVCRGLPYSTIPRTLKKKKKKKIRVTLLLAHRKGPNLLLTHAHIHKGV